MVSLAGIGDVLSIAAPILGAFGKAKNTQQAQATSGFETMPQKVKDYLLNTAYDDILALRNEPRPSIPYRRADASDYDPIFGSQARVALQRYYDEKAMPKEEVKSETTKSQSDNTFSNDALEAMVMAQYAMLPEARKQQALMNLQRVKSRAGQTNKYSGDTVDYGEWLRGQMKMGNSGAAQSLFPQANPDYQAGFMQQAPSYHAATYDPTTSLIGAILPSLAIAGMTAGAGLAGVPAGALNAIKGVTSLAGAVK